MTAATTQITPGESALKIDWEGQTYWLDIEQVTVRQAMVIQGFIGMSLTRLFDQFKDMTAAGDTEDTPEMFKAIICFYWLMRAQAGCKEPIADADVPLIPFMTALFTAMLATAPDQAEAEAEPVPTQPAGPPSPEPPFPPDTTQTPPALEGVVVPATA